MAQPAALAVIGVGALAFAIHFSIHKIEEGHVGVYYRGGALLSRTSEPGYHFMLPMLTSFRSVQNVVRSAAEEKYGKEFAEYTAVTYKSQVVAGTNFFVKVKVSDGEYVHLRVFRPLPNENSLPSLSDIQLNKSEADSIEYF